MIFIGSLYVHGIEQAKLVTHPEHASRGYDDVRNLSASGIEHEVVDLAEIVRVGSSQFLALEARESGFLHLAIYPLNRRACGFRTRGTCRGWS